MKLVWIKEWIWAVFHKGCNCFNADFLFQLQNLTVIISAVIDFKIPLHKIDLSWNSKIKIFNVWCEPDRTSRMRNYALIIDIS